MSSDFDFTVTSWFLGNVRKKPYFNVQWGDKYPLAPSSTGPELWVPVLRLNSTGENQHKKGCLLPFVQLCKYTMYLWRFYGSLLNDCDFWSSCFYSNSNMDKVLNTIHCVSKSSYETSSFKFTAEQLTAVLSSILLPINGHELKKFIMAQFHLFCWPMCCTANTYVARNFVSKLTWARANQN